MKSISKIIVLLTVISILLDAWNNAFGQNKTISKEFDFLIKNAVQLNFEANIEFEKKNYKEASKKYLEILHQKSNDISTLYNLSRCYAYMKKPIQAAELLQIALDAGLNDISSLLSDSAWVSIKNNDQIKQVMDNARRLKVQRGESFFVECKVINKCLLRQPDNYDSTNVYPLIVILHGNGGNAESYMNVRDIMGASTFFFAAPQGPYSRKTLQGIDPSYSWFYPSNDKNLWEKNDPDIIAYINDVIADIKSRYKVSGVYLLGHSQGGALAYMTGIKTPPQIDGIMCFGAGNPINVLSAAEIYNAKPKISIFIGHGLSDPQVNINDAIEAKRILTKYGYDVTVKTFSGGHWLDASTLIEAKKWIDNLIKK